MASAEFGELPVGAGPDGMEDDVRGHNYWLGVAIGAAAGSLVGGPVGAVYGAAVGGAVSNTYQYGSPGGGTVLTGARTRLL